MTGLVFGSLFPAQVAFAQGAGGSSPSSVPGAASAAMAMGQPGNVFGEVPERGWYLTGKVMMDDGTVPAESVTVLRLCGGVNRPMAYTDSKGRFSYQMGHDSGDVLPDASVDEGEQGRVALMSPIGNSSHEGRLFGSADNHQLAGCRLAASLPGYRSEVVELGGRRYMDNPDVGTIILHRVGGVEGTSISGTSYDAPHDAKKAYGKGLDAAKKQKWPEAQAQFEKAVAGYPKYASAWFELGEAFQHQGDKSKAREAFLKSVEADRRFLRPYLPLALMAFEEKNWAETVNLTATLTRLDAVDYPAAFLFNAVANVSLGQFEAAEKSAREAVRLDTNHQYPRAEYVLGLLLAGRRDYDGALALLKSYIQRAPNAPDGESIRKQISQIENLARVQPVAAPPEQPAARR